MTTFHLPFGACEVEVAGDGPAVLLVHGVLVNGDLWNPIVGPLSTNHRVIKPHLPIGAHRIPVQHVEHLHPEGIADSLASLLDQLGVERAVVIGNDTGGALSQIFTVRHPDRVEALILTSCYTYDNFPPRNPLRVRPLKALVSIPGIIDVIGLTYRSRWVRRTWLGAGLLMNKPIDDATIAPFFDQLSDSARSRRDMARFLTRCDKALTIAAEESLRSFPRPALLAWSRNDPLFPAKYAERLAGIIPNCQLQWITNAKCFSMLDQPEQLLDIVQPFLARLSPGIR
jgi:pimeloyl-ACP methyl ester carboxylesterase